MCCHSNKTANTFIDLAISTTQQNLDATALKPANLDGVASR